MKRRVLALTVGLLLLLTAAGTAMASPPAGQSSGQLAGSEQDAGAAAATAQQEPANDNASIRVLSPGDDGDVSQANVASSDATAANVNATGQSANQTQAGSPGLQTVGQSALSDQDALALALTAQDGASNGNAPVRVLSPGDGGDVAQANVASSDATAGNANLTGQEAGQQQAGTGCCSGGGTQVVGQSATSEQDAGALSATKQESPSNTNITVRVLSPGDDGDVSQANIASSEATAGNLNATKQAADQTQSGDSCKCGNAGSQTIGQSAKSDQNAGAAALTEQKGASNTNVTVRVLSPGNGGNVSQANVAASKAGAGNANLTAQGAEQTAAGGSCGCAGSGQQVIGQAADSQQNAAALSATKQDDPSNTNATVRVLSPGDDGDVSQANIAVSDATAINLAATEQDASQAQAGGSGVQAIGQSAKSDQDALALGLTLQQGATNENAPVRVLSPGDGGDVSQANVAASEAEAGNLNLTGQQAEQTLGGGTFTGHCCGGTSIQAIGQLSDSSQGAVAVGIAAQLGAKQPCRCKDGGFGSSNDPVRVLSPGDDGAVSQANVVWTKAKAGNVNLTHQGALQTSRGCGCGNALGIQAIGQAGLSSQGAGALAAGLQSPARKTAAVPERW